MLCAPPMADDSADRSLFRVSTKTQTEENRAVIGWSCCGPYVVLKDEAVATPWGVYEGAVNLH